MGRSAPGIAVAPPAWWVATHTRATEAGPSSGTTAPVGSRYAPFRRPDESVLYRVVQEHLATFLARAEEGGSLPRFVKREFEAFLACGIPIHGFIRVRCENCRLDGFVAFSCKGRGFCPSCGGRRMADTAAHLVDRVLPEVPVRQWVLSLPYPVRFLLAYDRRLCTRVLGTFLRSLLAWHRRRAREWLGFREAETGTVTVIQRFGSTVNLNVHFHVLSLDGVYAPTGEPDGPEIRFHALPAPETEEVAELLAVVSRRILRLLVRCGRLRETQDGYRVVSREELAEGPEASVLASCQSASVQSRLALGPRAGMRVRRLGDRVEGEWGVAGVAGQPPRPRCAEEGGFSLHADVSVNAQDRKRLERLCRYILRPALATERLTECEDGRVAYALRRPWRDGTTAVLFEPLELIEKLVAIVPAPRGHMVRYHGVLAPHARWREDVVRDRRQVAPGGMGREPSAGAGAAPQPGPAEEGAELRERRLSWAQLMLRVFEKDVLECPRCGGRRRLIGVLTESTVIVAFLESLGLPPRAPPRGRVREEDPGQAEPGEADLLRR